MKKKKRWITIIQIIVSLSILFLALAFYLLLPTKLFQKPGGPFQVGTTSRYVVDSTRSETLSPDPDDKRELYLQIWYPANKNDRPRARYGAHMPEMLAEIARKMELPSFLLGHLKSVKTYSALDAELSSKKSAYPVILFSHGFGLYGFQNTFQMEELASQGYIAVSIQHPYHSLLTVFPDGRAIPDQSNNLEQFDTFIEMNKMINEVWIKDAQFVIDYLEKLNGAGEEEVFGSHIDLTRVGMMGHSFGGAAAAQALLLDPRVKAAVNLDGTLMGMQKIPAEGLPGPFMQLSANEIAAPVTATPEEIEKKWEKIGIPEENYNESMTFLSAFEHNQKNAFNNDGYYVWLKGASHYTFTDIVLYSPLVPFILKDKINTKLAHRTINEYTLAFFDHYLRQIESPLLQPVSSDIVEVTINNK